MCKIEVTRNRIGLVLDWSSGLQMHTHGWSIHKMLAALRSLNVRMTTPCFSGQSQVKKSTNLSIYLFIRPPICLSTYLSVQLSIYLAIDLGEQMILANETRPSRRAHLGKFSLKLSIQNVVRRSNHIPPWEGKITTDATSWLVGACSWAWWNKLLHWQLWKEVYNYRPSDFQASWIRNQELFSTDEPQDEGK